jgi:hypothetical protein
MDSFSFRVSDGELLSSEAIISLTVRHVNQAPTALPQTIALDQGAQVAIRLAGEDPEGAVLAFIVGLPTNGVLSGTAPELVYTPRAGFHGADSFGFRVSDGELLSPEAIVTITVRPLNHRPDAISQAITLDEDTGVLVQLAGHDPDLDPVSYIVEAPSHGTLSGTAPLLLYRPNRDFSGNDSFRFKVSDGHLESAQAVVSITVRGIQDPPVAIAKLGLVADVDGSGHWLAVSGNGTNASVVLDGTMSFDADNDPLEFVWFADGGVTPVAMVARSTNSFELGVHVVTLYLSDGFTSVQTNITFEVLTVSEALDELCRQIKESTIEQNRIRPLLASCEAAQASFRRGNTTSGVNQLHALRGKLEAQIEPNHWDLARRWDAFIELIIKAVPPKR